MNETIVFRLLNADDKAAALSNAVTALREGQPTAGVTFAVDSSSFQQVPGSPFAYWVSEATRRTFAAFPTFEGNGREVRLGDHPSDDFRYLRLNWEILAGRSHLDWRPYQKGGEFSPYYCDIHLVVDWDSSRQTYRDFHGRPGRSSERPSNWQYFFRPGLTWPRRTTSGMSVRALPSGCIFADKGPSAFAAFEQLPPLLALMNSTPFASLIALQVAAADAAARSYEVGIIQRTPVPPIDALRSSRLAGDAFSSIDIKRWLDSATERSHAFTLPALLQAQGGSRTERSFARQERVSHGRTEMAQYQRDIDNLARSLYGISMADGEALEATRQTVIALPADIETEDEAEGDTADSINVRGLAADLVSYALGCAFGRWDIRIAFDPTLAAKLAGPFDPLPVCSPGMLVGPDGLPATRERIASDQWLRARPDVITMPPVGAVTEPTIDASAYPLTVAWDGILVDDPEHPEDIVRRVRMALALAWGGADGQLSVAAAEALERDLCAALGVPAAKDVREYFRNPRSFFEEHVRRYSKSRRKAPIYWLLQSKGRLYGLWLAYHRLDADLLYKALMRYVAPKLALEEARLRDLAGQRASADTAARRATGQAYERQLALLADLRDFQEKLARAAALALQPDLDDGVLLNAAPLWELLPWKAARDAWEELGAGKYAWSSIGQQLRAKGLVRRGA